MTIPKSLIAIFVLVLIGIIWLSAKYCHTPDTREADKNRIIDSLKSHIKDQEWAFKQKKEEDDSVIGGLNLKNSVIEKKLQSTHAKLENGTNSNQDLNERYLAVRAQRDTLQQLVKCDSLSDKVSSLTSLVKQEGRELEQLNATHAALRKEYDESRAKLYREVTRVNNECQIALSKVKALPQPGKVAKIKGYLGAEAATGGGKLVDGFGPKLTLEHISGTMYSGGIKFFNGQIVYEMGIHKLISFKKK